MKILAFDMGKFKTVWCMVQGDSVRPVYGKAATTPQALHDLLVEHQPDRLVLEVGPAAGWVCDLAAQAEPGRLGEERCGKTRGPKHRKENSFKTLPQAFHAANPP